MTTETQRITERSSLVGLVRTTLVQLRAWVAASWLARTSTAITSRLAVAADASFLAESVRTNARWIHHSYLYRWLTKEPDPDIVVIDLRETYTVGPVIALLDRLTPVLERAWRESYAHRASQRLRNAARIRWVENSTTIRLLVAALEPPEPPEEERRG